MEILNLSNGLIGWLAKWNNFGLTLKIYMGTMITSVAAIDQVGGLGVHLTAGGIQTNADATKGANYETNKNQTKTNHS
jgi:hypothetical protein